MKAKIFFFDYVGFLAEAHYYVKETDKGNHSTIVTYARNLANQFANNGWILEGLGVHLWQLDALKSPPYLTGLAYLVLLSKYLQTSRISYSSFSFVSNVASLLDWSSDEVALLCKGIEPHHLLKPHHSIPSFEDKRWHDADNYWLWMRPPHAVTNGNCWYNQEMIQLFYDRLQESRSKYQEMDVDNLNLEVFPRPFQLESIKYYQESLNLFETALNNKVGLYRIVAT